MALWDDVTRALALTPKFAKVRKLPEQTRAIDSFTDLPGLTEQLLAVQGLSAKPWAPASINDALSVPAIYRAVTLIANTVGALTLEAYRQGVKLPQDQAPRLIVRPNPFTTPREFFRETAFSMAVWGEAWWWIAKRDSDGVALSLIPMPPYEVSVTRNERNLLRPDIRWRDAPMRNEDVVQIVLSRIPGTLRGSGPLQHCGAAASVAVAAQDWAANFFAGKQPSILIKSAVPLAPGEDGEGEADKLRSQWLEGDANMPKVIDPSIDSVTDMSTDPEKAQLVDTRRMSNGEAAIMFGIPGSLLDHVEPGGSLTYQNVGQEYDKFVRACLWPNYLEPIEQSMSDQLTRATVSRFNLSGLLRPDIKTRFEVYESGITKSHVLSVEEARQMEGFAPGDVETAPVPLSVPQAIPDRLPTQQRTAIVPEPEREIPPARSGPAPIVTRTQVLTVRARLQAQGKPYGYESIARELGVHRDTVRRRLLTASPEAA